MKALTSSLVLCAVLTASGTAQAALAPALGGQVVNDTDLNITWLANANLAATNTFGVSGINADGSMIWSTAQSWIGAMNTANYMGYNDWRLPTTLQPDASCGTQNNWGSLGYNCTGSEMGHLFYNELGGTAGSSISSSTDPDLALFSNVQSHSYWSDTEFAPNADFAWGFDFRYGFQTFHWAYLYALAVRPVDVAAVPEPATAWLLGFGLLGLIGVARRKTA